MVLLTEYFQSDPARRKEFDVCLVENIKNDSIKQIILFIDNPSVNPTDNFLESDKIRIHRTPDRPTYQDFFAFCNSNLSGETCIIANADIIVGKDIDKAEAHPDFGNMFVALTRWDLAKKEDGTFSSTFFCPIEVSIMMPDASAVMPLNFKDPEGFYNYYLLNSVRSGF